MNPYLYDGRDRVRYDQETQLYWLSVRAYDPSLGRFLSRDPLGRLASIGLDTQPYVYANNNPISYVDPSGMRPFLEEGLASDSQAYYQATRESHSIMQTIKPTLGCSAAREEQVQTNEDNALKDLQDIMGMAPGEFSGWALALGLPGAAAAVGFKFLSAMGWLLKALQSAAPFAEGVGVSLLSAGFVLEAVTIGLSDITAQHNHLEWWTAANIRSAFSPWLSTLGMAIAIASVVIAVGMLALVAVTINSGLTFGASLVALLANPTTLFGLGVGVGTIAVFALFITLRADLLEYRDRLIRRVGG